MAGVVASRNPTVGQVFWIGDTCWNVLGKYRDRLFDGDGLRLEAWQREGAATLIKNGSGRTIYHVRLPDLDLYIKHFKSTSVFSMLHQLVRRGKAEKEFHLANVLSQNGVATISPVALGERRRNGMLTESYLLTEAIPNGMTLYEFVERWILPGRIAFPASMRFYLTQLLAKLTATIHDAGIEHRDLHEKNIIVQPDGQGGYQLFLLDLHELRLHAKMAWKSAERELSRMGRYFTLRTNATDRYRFFLEYARLRGIPRNEARELAREVEQITEESRADFWRRRDTRPQKRSTTTREYSAPGIKAFAMAEIAEEPIARLMADPEAPFRENVAHWWKLGRGTRVAEVHLPELKDNGTLIYKQYFFKGWHESLAAQFRPNQASRAWSCGAALLLRELPTPKPLMVIHQMCMGLPVTSYLLTERAPNAQPITRYLERTLSALSPAERRKAWLGVLREAALLLRKMHDRRITHRDLKASNILATPTEKPGEPKLWLIDLDSVQTWQDVPHRHRMQNISRFYVSFHHSPWITLTDRVRFLRLYLGRQFHVEGVWKTYWREIYRQAQKKIQRNLRYGRSVV